MAWLRADHEALRQQWEHGATERDRDDACWRLQLRRYDVALEAVRDEPQLQKLPDHEQAAWRQLWSDALAPLLRQQTRF
jgi:hypothetical protein